jgi:hypothetical protein
MKLGGRRASFTAVDLPHRAGRAGAAERLAPPLLPAFTDKMSAKRGEATIGGKFPIDQWGRDQ